MSVARMLLPELTAVHDRFLALSLVARERFGNTLGGKLLLRCGLDAEGIAAVVAASVAGAASLCVDADADRLREGLRAGLVDFVVGQLDEALRILKNEIRRALPVSVGLTADPASCIDAMIERGLQPDLLAAIPQRQASIFVERGACTLPEHAAPDPLTSILEWTASENPAQSLPRVARIAAESLDPARDDTPARRRWLEQSPRYLGRAFGSRQCLRMTEAEISAFLPRVRDAVPTAKITRDGEKA
jgi:Urocanase Rossmann-like domain